MILTRFLRWVERHPVVAIAALLVVLSIVGHMDLQDAMRGAR